MENNVITTKNTGARLQTIFNTFKITDHFKTITTTKVQTESSKSTGVFFGQFYK